MSLNALLPRLRRVGRWLHARLVEAPRSVIGTAERRRAGLLAIVQLSQTLQLVLTTVAVMFAESGSMRTVVPEVMVVVLGVILVSYALVRRGKVQTATWLYLGANLATTPAIFLAVGPTPDFEPFINLAFLLPAVLLASTISTARVTLLTALGGLVASGVPMYVMGPAAWHRPLQHGTLFVLANMGLVLTFGVHRNRIEVDRSTELRIRNEELESLRRTLEQKVEERTAALSAREAHSRLVLDNVSQGVFTVDAEGRVVGEPSAALVRWFGPYGTGMPFFEYFTPFAPRFASIARCAWDQLQQGWMPLEVALGQVPGSFGVEGRHYEIQLDPVETETGRCFLVVVSDVTAHRQREQLEEQARERFVLFEQMQRDRGAFVDFIDEVDAILQRLRSTTDLVDFAREVHTLKGNALSLGLDSIGRLCHAVEDRLAEDLQLPTPQDLAELTRRCELLVGDANRLLGARKDCIEISKQQYVELLGAATSIKGGGDLVRIVAALEQEGLSGRLEHLADQARRIAARLDKRVDVELNDDGSRVAAGQWAGLWASLIHAVRNALDHGIEPAEERVARGKPERGHLALRAHSTNDRVTLQVEDDGRGIDTEMLSRQLGRPVTDAELLDLICGHGVSTSTTPTETSGRGVGMGALRAAVQAAGGELALETQRGRGTRLRITVPRGDAPPMQHAAA